MKAEIHKTTCKKNALEPFVLELTVETIQEARLLFHVFNHANLASAIANSMAYNIEPRYSPDVQVSFGGNEIYPLIRRAVEKQGFSI